MIQNAQKKEKEGSDPHWDKENLMLKTNAEANSRLRQEITKQSYADSVVQHSINTKILDLKNTAMKLAKGLENEKRKNLELQAIIKHMNFIRQESKRQEATFRDDLNYESVDNLSRKIKKMQYDLDQINSKSNNLNSKNNSKKHEVDAFRTQRVIDSSIFLKIEKELIDSSMKFKKLLIEKIKCEKEYQKNLNNYMKMKNDIGKQQIEFSGKIAKQQSNQQSQDGQHEQFFVNAPEINHATKFTDLDLIDPKKRRYSANSKRVNSVHEVKKQKNYDEEFAVKKLFIDTGLNQDNFFQHFNGIEEINEDLYSVLNSTLDQTSELQDKILKIQQIKERKKVNYYQGEPKLSKPEIQYLRAKNLEKTIKEEDFKGHSSLSQINQFLSSETLKKLSQSLEIELGKVPEDESLGVMEDKFKELENKICPIIDFIRENQISCEESTNLAKEENVEQLISKIKKIEESEKVMSRNDFKKEYDKIKKNNNKVRAPKKKPTFKKN